MLLNGLPYLDKFFLMSSRNKSIFTSKVYLIEKMNTDQKIPVTTSSSRYKSKHWQSNPDSATSTCSWYAICPDCDTHVNCGTIGLANLAKHHHGKKICCSKCKRVPRKAADALWGNPQQFIEWSTGVQASWLWNSESVGKYIIFWLLFQLLTHFLYHLQCIELEWEPRSWVCIACEASEVGERYRWYYHI